MAKYFMAGVANAEILTLDGDLFATAKTLTESSITVGNSAEEVRGGEGAALRGKYYHTSSFELTLTDCMFSLEYLAASIGADIDRAGADIMFEETRDGTAVTSGNITLSKTPVAFGCSDNVYAYYTLAGKDEWKKVTLSAANVSAKTIADSAIVAGNKYCVKYFYLNTAARKITVKSDYVPSTLHVILTTKLFAGDVNSGSNTAVGKVIIDVPRFQLDGSQDLQMSMTGTSTTNLKGSALATECSAECEANTYYAEIIESIDAAAWYDDAKGMAIDGGAISVATGTPGVNIEFPDVYLLYINAIPKKINDLAASDDSVRIHLTAVDMGTTTLTINASGDGFTGTATAGATPRAIVAVKLQKKVGEEFVDIAGLEDRLVINVA